MKMKKILFILCIFAILPAFASNVTIESKKQSYDSLQNKTFLDGGVKVKMDDMTITSPRAVVDVSPDGKIQKANFLDKVYAIKDDKINQQEIKSDIMTMSLLDKKVRAEGNTISTFSEKRVPSVILTADYQEFDTTKNLMRATGNLKITHKDVIATGKEAQMKLDKNNKVDKMRLVGNAVITEKESIVTANNIIYNPKSEEIIAMGNSHTHTLNEDGSKFDIYANLQQYDRKTKSLMTSGAVKMTYQNYVGEGPKATFLSDPKTHKINRLIFYGRSKVQEGDKIVEADKIILVLKPKNFTAEGNVKTSFKNVEGFSDDSALGGKK